MSNKRMFFIRVADRPGVLFRITSVFRRRNFNIESVAVGKANIPGESKIVISIDVDEEGADAFARLVKRIIDVYEVIEAPQESCTLRELTLVRMESNEAGLENVCKNYGAKLTVNGGVYIEYCGEPQNSDMLLKELGKYKIKDISRTGVTALVKESGKDILRFGH
ncbi:MAG: acetolactate synthase small subunit [Nitrososphaerota archaeon]|jgi:acetolactate synthase-1/3 small subunit|nr:acetolactate synthase small subunit [Nitrososphaerota archaeon]MDG6931881.1 acetolactate synthase small subunit [Nitrososphaerota archaeon]MDG6936599.1 acetolactate synthase small subunit [Nitrososphaerota archaeon]MDG6944393.1 acetolactate synthase small subunit [Nitrososphaerota archaeon]